MFEITGLQQDWIGYVDTEATTTSLEQPTMIISPMLKQQSPWLKVILWSTEESAIQIDRLFAEIVALMKTNQ